MTVYTIKYDATTNHIAGVTTRSGKDVCGTLSSSGSFETGQSYDDIRDALQAVYASSRYLCRTCKIGAEITANRMHENG